MESVCDLSPVKIDVFLIVVPYKIPVSTILLFRPYIVVSLFKFIFSSFYRFFFNSLFKWSGLRPADATSSKTSFDLSFKFPGRIISFELTIYSICYTKQWPNLYLLLIVENSFYLMKQFSTIFSTESVNFLRFSTDLVVFFDGSI